MDPRTYCRKQHIPPLVRIHRGSPNLHREGIQCLMCLANRLQNARLHQRICFPRRSQVAEMAGFTWLLIPRETHCRKQPRCKYGKCAAEMLSNVQAHFAEVGRNPRRCRCNDRASPPSFSAAAGWWRSSHCEGFIPSMYDLQAHIPGSPFHSNYRNLM